MKSLKNKLLLYVSLILVCTVFFLTTISAVLFYRSATSQAEQDSAYLAAAYQEGINSVLNAYRSDMEIVAKKSYLTDGVTSAQQQKTLLADEAKAIGFTKLVLTTAQGTSDNGDKLADQSFFKQAQSGKTCFSDPADSSSGQLRFLIATPVGTNGGILYGEVSYDTFAKAFDRIKIGESGYAFVINHSGLTVVHPEKANVEKPTDYIAKAKQDTNFAPIAKIYQHMIAGETGTGYSNYKGVRRLVAYAPLSGPESWSVAVTTPVTQLDQNLYQTLVICVLAGFLLLLAAVFATRIFSAKMTAPIVRATRRIEELEKGNLQAEAVAISGRDESARLLSALQNTTHSLRTYISDISHVLDQVAAKNLTAKSTVAYTGDFVSIQSSLRTIVTSLRETLCGIAQATEQVRVGSEQVAASGQNLADSSAEQAATTEQLTDSLRQISDLVQNNAVYSASMKETAEAALSETLQGNQEMQNMLQSMENISESSKKIQGIIHMIDDIASQTNILALNATVEAARAGDAGKGFSVVAEEVRQLANRSAEAAKSTAELIEATINLVGKGMMNAENTAGAFQKIVEQTNQINGLVSKMSSSLDRQSQKIVELNEGMDRIASVTQSNSATAEESAATSEELLNQTQVLNRMVTAFHFEEN